MRYSLRCLALCGILVAGMAHAGDQRTVVLITWDGTHPSYITPADAPTLTALGKKGAHATRMIPIFPSSTFPNHTTLATGCTADAHGIVSNQFVDPKRGEFDFSKDSTWIQCEPIWASAEKAGLKSAVLLWPSTDTPWNGISPRYLLAFGDRKVDEVLNLPEWPRYEQVLNWLALPELERPRLVMIYLPNIDTQGHNFGPGSKEVQKAVKAYDKDLGKFMAKLKKLPIYPMTDVIVVSDHGMALMKHTISLPAITADLAKHGVKEVKVTASGTNANLYFKSVAQAARAVKALQTLGSQSGTFTAYGVDGLPAELHYRNARSGVTLIGNEGYYFNKKGASDQLVGDPPNTHVGKHGHPPLTTPSMSAIFYAHGPDFPAGTMYEKISSTEVAPMIRKILGLPQGASQ